MWTGKARFREVFINFDLVHGRLRRAEKRIEVLERGREVSAKLKGSGIQDCMRLITTMRADLTYLTKQLGTHTTRLDGQRNWQDKEKERFDNHLSTIVAMQEHTQRLQDRIEILEALTQPLQVKEASDRLYFEPLGAAEGAMSHVTPPHSQFNYGTWDRGAMRHAENLRGIAEATTVPKWTDILKAAADFLEETVAASEGSYK